VTARRVALHFRRGLAHGDCYFAAIYLLARAGASAKRFNSASE